MRKDDRSQGRLQRAAFPVVTNENEALRLNACSAARLFRPASTVTKFPRQTGITCHAGHKESGGRPTEPFTETRRNRQPSAGNQPGNDNPDNSRKKRTVSFETAFREYGRPVHSITVTKPDTPETRSAFYRERSPAIRSPFTRKKHRPRRKNVPRSILPFPYGRNRLSPIRRQPYRKPSPARGPVRHPDPAELLSPGLFRRSFGILDVTVEPAENSRFHTSEFCGLNT